MPLPPNVPLVTLIGIGSFGKVYKTWWNGKPAAVKVFHELFFDAAHPEFINEFSRLYRFLQRLKHKNVVQVLEFFISEFSPPMLLTELLDCDLRTFVERHTPNRIPFPDTVSIVLDVAEGLVYLHHQCKPPIIHRHITSKNIMLSEQRQAKINDFGAACYEGKTIFNSPVPGTTVYAAPETYPDPGEHKAAGYGAKIDIFSFGVVLMEVINGTRPYMQPTWSPFEHGLYKRSYFIKVCHFNPQRTSL